ncbi:hypothetical protein [Streptomyces canarius]
MFDDRVYKRGALCLHALRLAIGDEDFSSAAISEWTTKIAISRYFGVPCRFGRGWP